MAKKEDDKWENSVEEEEEEDEEEALSLCDLPINLVEEKSHDDDRQLRKEEEEEDFDFSQFGCCVSAKSEMCSADDIFFQGQILPFRLSVSSETTTSTYKSSVDSLKVPSISRSQSMDHGFSSRSSSSSSRSQFSSSTTSTTTTSSSSVNQQRISISKQPRSRIQTQFHTHPSPKAQIKVSTPKNNRAIRKSTAWDIFRLGLIRTPEIELQDLKNRSSVSRNSSSNSSNSSNTNHDKKVSKTTTTGLLSGCSCTVNAIKPVPLNTPIIRTTEQAKRLKKTKKKKKMTEKQRGKQAMSRHRTFEWIKELSHVSFDEQ